MFLKLHHLSTGEVKLVPYLICSISFETLNCLVQKYNTNFLNKNEFRLIPGIKAL